jgi:hypothetical protein
VVMEGEENRVQGELRYVYQRRGIENVLTVTPVPSFLSRPSLILETPTPSTTNLGNIIPLDFSPVMLRRTSRNNAGNSPDCYGFPHNIDQYVNYSNLSVEYETFIASLDSVAISKCWQVAKWDPKWEVAMHEESHMGACITTNGKKAVGCK